MKLDGGEPVVATPTVDLRAVADLERKGQVLSASPEQEFEQYRSAVAKLNKPDDKSNQKKDYRSINDLATPDVKKKLNKNNDDAAAANQTASLVSMLLKGFGGLVFILGAFLWIGNVSRLFPTFPLAGYITMTIGGAIIGVGKKM